MTHDGFFAALKRGEIAPVYLFSGEETLIQDRALAALRKLLLPDGLEAMNEAVLTNPRADEIIEAAETLPMLADRRLVVVRDSLLLLPGKAAGEAEDAQKLADYLDRAPDSACVVFFCRVQPDGRKKLTLALNKKAAAVKFDRLNDAQLTQWIGQQMRTHGKTISPGAAQVLAFTAGRELQTLAQEIAKTAAYLGDRTEVAQEDIERVATPSLECTIFQLVDALVEGKEAESFRLLRVMLENGESRIGILAMMARQYRNLFHLKRMQEERVPDAEIARRIGVPPFALRRLYAQAKGADKQTLRARLDLCVDTDYAIKSGKMHEDAALDRAIFMLCTR